MCAPGWLERLSEKVILREPAGLERAAASTAAHAKRVEFTQIVDLTHVLSPEFPTYSGEPGIAFETILEYERDRKNVKRWIVHEHVGTHFDAPIHFSVNALCSHEVSIDRVPVPLAVIDISHRAESNPDTELTPDDILKWEAEHGPLPSGGCLAMNSGWDRHAGSPKFRNADPANTLHFPGFHAEATELLLERDVAGVGVDTLSIDCGYSTTFPSHYAWLPRNRWAVEGLANLSSCPPRGAYIAVGAPLIRGATGGPSRMFALV